MNLKTYTAPNMAGALALVKRDLGPDAVILHTRTYKRGGILGFGARNVVEITATDRAHAGRGKRPADRRPAAGSTAHPAARPGARPGVRPGARPVVESRTPAPGPSSPTAMETASTGDLIRRTYAAARAEFARTAAASTPVPAAGAPAPSVTVAPIAPGNAQLAQEMRDVKRLVEQLMRQQQQRPAPDVPEALFDQYMTLLKQEVTEELAEEIVGKVRERLAPAELASQAQVRKAVLDEVATLIPTDQTAGVLEKTPDGRPRTIALIGPTGVGKTTTIAKLAANFKLRQKKSVGLVTLDTYRIAAVDQLRTYANIIGVPLHVVSGVEEMAQALRRCAGCDVVLIDTAGRSQRDDPRLEQLGAFIRAADPHEVHLVLSSTCTQAVMLDAAERFSRIRTDRIIFTKLDEAVSFGVLLNVARKVNKRLSFVTTGQEVPHHIEPGRSERLAALVLGEGV